MDEAAAGPCRGKIVERFARIAIMRQRLIEKAAILLFLQKRQQRIDRRANLTDDAERGSGENCNACSDGRAQLRPPRANRRGNNPDDATFRCQLDHLGRASPVNGLIYLVGLVVVIMAILSFLGLR